MNTKFSIILKIYCHFLGVLRILLHIEIPSSWKYILNFFYRTLCDVCNLLKTLRGGKGVQTR